jgi:hypothetical protein
MALRKTGHEEAFMDASGEVIRLRREFGTAHDAAKTDSQRHRVEQAFLAELPKRYARVDNILDAHNELRNAL